MIKPTMTLLLKLQFLCLLLFTLSANVHAVDDNQAPVIKASISDLQWMTGTWSGEVGEQTLEENWIQPAAGTLAALVRMMGNGNTSMVELIVIEQVGDSLELHIQQWDPGMVARTAGPQKMRLRSVGEAQVGFEALDAGGIELLSYTRPAADRFIIDITTSEGETFQIKLSAQLSAQLSGQGG